MKKSLSRVFAAVFVALLAGCGRDVPGDAKPIIGSALSGEFGVPVRCVAVKDVKKVENEKDSFTAVAVCDIGGREQSGGITVKYKDDKPVVGIIGFGYPEIVTVKNGVLNTDKTRTVEQMLSAKLDNLQWKCFVSTENRRVVEVSGVWKDKQYREMAQNVTKGSLEWALSGGLIPLFPFDGDKMTLQFVIHADGRRFGFAYAEIRDSNDKIKETETGFKATTSSAYEDRDKFLNLFNQ